MSQKAQAGLEYLMTYGWALVIIASVVGVLVFVINPTSATASFSSSDPSKIMLKGSSITENTASLVLQNTTGGTIKINSIHFFGDLGADSGWALNGVSPKDFPIELSAGSELAFGGLVSQNNCTGGGTVVIFYSDQSGLPQRANIKCNAGTKMPVAWNIKCNAGTKMPVAWYRFDESSGEIASDSSGNGNNGTLKPAGADGPVWVGSECPSESCLQFDGDNDYVVKNPVVDFPETEITTEFWMKTPDIIKTGSPVSYAVTTSNNEFLVFNYKRSQPTMENGIILLSLGKAVTEKQNCTRTGKTLPLVTLLKASK